MDYTEENEVASKLKAIGFELDECYYHDDGLSYYFMLEEQLYYIQGGDSLYRLIKSMLALPLEDCPLYISDRTDMVGRDTIRKGIARKRLEHGS